MMSYTCTANECNYDKGIKNILDVNSSSTLLFNYKSCVKKSFFKIDTYS